MALYQAPSFEALEMLSRSRDADLARRELLDPDRILSLIHIYAADE